MKWWKPRANGTKSLAFPLFPRKACCWTSSFSPKARSPIIAHSTPESRQNTSPPAKIVPILVIFHRSLRIDSAARLHGNDQNPLDFSGPFVRKRLGCAEAGSQPHHRHGCALHASHARIQAFFALLGCKLSESKHPGRQKRARSPRGCQGRIGSGDLLCERRRLRKERVRNRELRSSGALKRPSRHPIGEAACYSRSPRRIRVGESRLWGGTTML